MYSLTMAPAVLALVTLLLTLLSQAKAFRVREFLTRDVGGLCESESKTKVSCDDAGADGLLAHPDSCQLFYQCVGAAAACRACPAGLHFSPGARACVRPARAACAAAADGLPMPPADPNPIGGAYENNIPQRCINNSVTAVSCAGAPAPDSLLPHPDDCELFYYCVGADAPPVCRQCPAGLHFNPHERVCDQPQDAGCQAPSTVGMFNNRSYKYSMAVKELSWLGAGPIDVAGWTQIQ